MSRNLSTPAAAPLQFRFSGVSITFPWQQAVTPSPRSRRRSRHPTHRSLTSIVVRSTLAGAFWSLGMLHSEYVHTTESKLASGTTFS